MVFYSLISRLTAALLIGGAFLLLFTTTGCEDAADDHRPQTLEGARVPIGDGEAWAEVTLDTDGDPTDISAAFTEAALMGLPRDMGMHAHEFVLPLPAGANVPPFDHLTLDWNAHGHAPPGVYDLPHFDVHFYWMSATQRDRIVPEDTAAFNRPLPAEQLAPAYLETPGGVPRMGAHIIDLMSPEIAGTGTFTHTFIYGKYDGRLNFLEPMVSEDFLLSRQDVSQDIRWPASFGTSGYFPTRYEIEYEEATGIYRVRLGNLQRQ